MRPLLQSLLAVALAFVLSGCLFKEAVFTEGFSKVDPGLGAVWATEERADDPRTSQFAVCAPLDQDRYLVHYPAGTKDGIYYEARLIKVRDHNLLQLRALASFSDGLPKADAERFTIVWIENDMAGPTIQVHALNGDLKEKPPAEVKRLLEAPSGHWGKLFGDPIDFRRLKEK